MKKISILLLALFTCTVFLLTACGGGFSVTTANIKDVAMTTDVDSEGKPIDTVTSYAADAPKFVVSAILANAPDNTQVKFVWLYDGETLYETTIDSGNISSRYISCELTNTNAWPQGKYTVEFYIDEGKEPKATMDFTVE